MDVLKTQSRRAVFWMVFGSLSFTVAPAALYFALQANFDYRASLRVLALAEADCDLLMFDDHVRQERALTLLRLGAAENQQSHVTQADLDDLRRRGDASIAETSRTLQALGRGMEASQLLVMHRAFTALREASDQEASHLSTKQERNQAGLVMKAGTDITTAVRHAEETLDGLIRDENPALTPLLSAKRALNTARSNFGFAALQMHSAIWARRGWTRDELATYVRRWSAASQALAIAKDILASQQYGPGLANALNAVDASFLAGPLGTLRSNAAAQLQDGNATDATLDGFVDQELQSLSLLSTAAVAAVDEIVRVSKLTTQSSLSRLAVRGAALALALGLVCCGFWVERMLRRRALEQRRAREEELRSIETRNLRLTTEQSATAEVATLVVGSIGAGLERLAKGDLAFRLDASLPPPFEKLRLDLNSAADALEALVSHITRGTSEIQNSIGHIANAADDLSRRTEHQAASLEQTAAALHQITTTVTKTANGTKHASEIVAAAKAGAQTSGAIVQKAVTAMDEIDKSSKQIALIVGVIDKIAAQTNLLALNAGVEAARAGESGRGFAVVATEVRSLAARSADAAREIKALINSAAQQVGAGVQLVALTGQSFVRISEQVGEISAVVSEIAASANEQASGLAEVNIAINHMDQVTQQNAVMVEQSTAACHSLAQETEMLGRLTARFTIKSTGTDGPKAPLAPRPRAKPHPSISTVSPSDPRTGDWTEF